MPEVDGLPLDLGADSTNVDMPQPPAQGQIVSFDAGRSTRKKSRSAMESTAGPTSVTERSHGSSAVAPVVEIARAPAVAPLPPMEIPLTESYEAPKRGLPIWVWAVAAAGLAAGIYFAFFRTTPTAADPTPAASTATPVAPSTPPAPQEPRPAPVASGPSEVTEPAAPPIATPTKVAVAAVPTPPPANPALTPTPSPIAKKSQPPVVPAPAAKELPEPTPEAPASESLEDPSLAVAAVAPAVSVPAPAKPVTRPGDLVSLNEVDTLPIGIEKPSPQYTNLGRTRRQEGTVVFEVLVTETGRVADVRLIRGIAGSDLNDAALDAARSWVYKPAEKDGVPVRVWRPEQVRFKL
jgi:protein TonB